MNTPIQYIGRKPSFKDVLYGTGLTFVSDQVRELPHSLAAKFLRHNDLFKEPAQLQNELAQKDLEQSTDPIATNAQQGNVVDTSKEQSTQIDDTAALLETAQKLQDEQAQKDLERAGLMDQIRVMTKPELVTLAKDRWNQEFDKRLGLENVRERVIQFVDQFGAA